MNEWFNLKATLQFLCEVLILLLGVYGVPVFSWLQGKLAKCNHTAFGMIGIMAVFVILTYLKSKIT